jgi:hypothetical protein
MISKSDQSTLQTKGISLETFESQLARFVTGFPYLRLSGAATPGNGIHVLDEASQARAIDRWHKYLSEGGVVTKMVPASGAASRMFKALYAYVDSDEEQPQAGSDVAKVAENIDQFAFIDDLNAKLQQLYGADAKTLIANGETKKVISAIIKSEGLNYGNLPKALLKFHSYSNSKRTPLEEHLSEGAQTAASVNGIVNVHFTVSADHVDKFNETIAKAVPALEQQYGVKFNISLSQQKPSTDTVAVNPDNTPFRENGNLVFRPGGHGALIDNLDDLDATVVFLKNIDNVVPESKRADTIKYKEVIAGVLMEAHDKIARYLGMLDSGEYTIDDLREMVAFLHDTLNIRHEKMKFLDDSELALFIRAKLDRPLRVCGMVKNEGEPGGGPYIAYNADGTTSPQILESSQIDLSNEQNKAMMESATHFNPVDLVCYIRRTDGSKYNLREYVDPETGFISSKSLHGKPLKALELPGLWNGAMSDWSTIFVEVPATTFNPVKTVNDLLRPAHQA